MKIAIVSTPVFKLGNTGLSGYGGLEHLAWLQAKGLAEKGHSVSIIAPDGSECPRVTVIPMGPERQVDERMAFERYKDHLLTVDCIVDNGWMKHSYLLKMEGKLKAPILGVMHAPINTMIGSPPPIEKPCIVCISEDQKLHYEALFGREARRCYNGVDGEIYKPLGIPRTDRFLFLARFSTVKSPDSCIEVCKACGVGLDLIGDTSITNEPEYLEKCKKMCDGKQITMKGPCSRGESVFWYSQAFGLLHLTHSFREPYGLSPVESMLCGLPVIAWKYGALKETIKHGETGFLVSSFQEAVNYVNTLRNKTEHGMKIMRENCREWALQFSVEKMVQRYSDLCEEAVSTGGW